MAPPSAAREDGSSAAKQHRQKQPSQDRTMESTPSFGYLSANPLVAFAPSPQGRRSLIEVDSLRTDEELNSIRKKLGECGSQITFCADVANTCNLRKILNSGCQMLHYAGHADDNFLAFESSAPTKIGFMEPLKVAPLKLMFAAGGVITKLVFISSCSSELSGNAFVEAGVPHVVAVKTGQSVRDQAALQFSDMFYDALIKNSGTFTVREAFEIALRTVDASPENLPKEEGDHFLLLPKDGNHDVRIFDTLQDGEFIDKTRYTPRPINCRRGVSSYRGLVELQKLVKLLVDWTNSCVTVTGERGSGKTEMAIQAADYARERDHFDAVLWTDCSDLVEEEAALAGPPPPAFADFRGAVDWSSESSPDPCRLIGIAAGMPFPGPESEMELHRFLFKNPANDGGPPCQKVLLVLENLDALLERGKDARDGLIILLSNLCSMGEKGQGLKLLVTSEQRLLLETSVRFHGGSEVEAKVGPLRPRAACKFLIDKLHRNFTRTELGIPKTMHMTNDNVRCAVLNHLELRDVVMEGHPGTLQRLAPTLFDDLASGVLKEKAKRVRDEFRVMPRRSRPRRTSSNTSAVSFASALTTSNSSLGNPSTPPPPPRPLVFTGSYDEYIRRLGRSSSLHPTHGTSPARAASNGEHQRATSLTDPVVLRRTCTEGCNRCADAHGHGGAFWNTNNHRIDTGYAQQQQQHPLDHPAPSPALSPSPSPSPAVPIQQPCPCGRGYSAGSGWEDRSRIGAVFLSEPDPPHMNLGEQRAWDAALVAGVADHGCRLVWVVATADAAADGGSRDHDHLRAPWECLKNALVEHLDGNLTVPSRQRRVAENERPYGRVGGDGEEEFVEGEDEGEEDEEEEDGGEGGGDGGAAGEEGEWYGAVGPRQGRVLSDRELAFIRGIQKNKQDSLRPENRPARATLAGGGGGSGNADMISVGEYAEFSHWWAPLMRTLSLIKPDWEETEPVRVHGFIGRFRADQELKRKKPGTFLLRFSERELGALVVSYRMHMPPRRVQHCLVRFRRGGCYFTENPTKLYSSLRDLVMETGRLTRLYPGTPKKAVFDKKSPPPAGPPAEPTAAPTAAPTVEPPEEGQGGGGGGGRGARLEGANSSTAEEKAPAPVLPQSKPPPYTYFEGTPPEGGAGRDGGASRGGRIGGAADDIADAGSTPPATPPQGASSPPPIYAEAALTDPTFRSLE